MKMTIKIPVLSSWRGNVKVFAPPGPYTDTSFQEALTAANNSRGPQDLVSIVEAEVEFLHTDRVAGKVSPVPPKG